MKTKISDRGHVLEYAGLGNWHCRCCNGPVGKRDDVCHMDISKWLKTGDGP